MKVDDKETKPAAERLSPRYFTGSEEGDESLFSFLGNIGALGGPAKEEYEKREKNESR